MIDILLNDWIKSLIKRDLNFQANLKGHLFLRLNKFEYLLLENEVHLWINSEQSGTFIWLILIERKMIKRLKNN